VTFHFVNPTSAASDRGSPEARTLALVRDGTAERVNLEEGPQRLVQETGGLVKRQAMHLDQGIAELVDTASAVYRIGVRLRQVEADRPYSVKVSVARKGVSVRHRSSLVASLQKSQVPSPLREAGGAAFDARRDERREGAARLASPPLPVEVSWKGKVRADEKKPGWNVYRVEVSVPYADLKFVVQEDAMMSSLKFELSAAGIGTTTAKDESVVDESPMMTAEEYREALDHRFVRAFLLTLPKGRYRIQAGVSDALGQRAGAATSEVTAGE
jgi:hypothetical protein